MSRAQDPHPCRHHLPRHLQGCQHHQHLHTMLAAQPCLGPSCQLIAAQSTRGHLRPRTTMPRSGAGDITSSSWLTELQQPSTAIVRASDLQLGALACKACSGAQGVTCNGDNDHQLHWPAALGARDAPMLASCGLARGGRVRCMARSKPANSRLSHGRSDCLRLPRCQGKCGMM